MPDPIPNAPADEELSASDIADLAGVSPSAVSNWRKRYSDFPVPIDSAGRWTRFRGAEVRAWLVANDKLPDPAAADTVVSNCDDLLWTAVEASRYSPESDPLDSLLKAAAFAATLVDPRDEAIRDDLRELVGQEPAPPKGLEHLASNPTLEIGSHYEVADSLLNAVDRIGSSNRNPYTTTSPSLSKRIAAATTPTDGLDFADDDGALDAVFEWYPDTIYDPCAGSGRLVRDIGEEHRDIYPHVIAQEIDPTMAKIASLVVALTEVSFNADVPVQIGDSLLDDKFPDLKADLVVAHPPFGMRLPDGLEDDPRWILGDPGRDGSWAWMQIVLSKLSDRGRAAVIVEPSWAWRGGRSRELRANLIRQNYLDAVIELPPGTFQGMGVGGLLVLLAKDRANRRHPRGAGEIWFCNSSMPSSDGPVYHPSEALEASYTNWRDHNVPIQSFEALLELGPLLQSGAIYPAGSGSLTGDEVFQGIEKVAESVQRGELSQEALLAFATFMLLSTTSDYEAVADNDFDLTPRRYLSLMGGLIKPSLFGEVAANAAQAAKASISSTKATATAIQPVRDFYAELQPEQQPALRMTTLGDLRDAGQIELIAGSGTGRATKDPSLTDDLPGMITASWVREASAGNKPSITTLVTKSAQIDQEALLQVDDVIFDTSDKTSVWTVTKKEAGSALGVGLYAIRLNGQSPDPVGLTPTFVAVWARTNHLSDQIKKFSIGEVVSKIRMRDLQRIAIPTPADEAASDWFIKQLDLHSDLRTAHEDLSKFVADLPNVEAKLLDSLIASAEAPGQA
ncbi:MAG: N-6 DNA methylase [Gemmatimonadales bacterium]|nr:N-6 DNA methylase [Gemmatimonadales bacterium]